jgi:hypothetical protein
LSCSGWGSLLREKVFTWGRMMPKLSDFRA